MLSLSSLRPRVACLCGRDAVRMSRLFLRGFSDEQLFFRHVGYAIIGCRPAPAEVPRHLLRNGSQAVGSTLYNTFWRQFTASLHWGFTVHNLRWEATAGAHLTSTAKNRSRWVSNHRRSELCSPLLLIVCSLLQTETKESPEQIMTCLLFLGSFRYPTPSRWLGVRLYLRRR